MKWVHVFLFGLLILLGANATAQRRPNMDPGLRQHMNQLRLTDEQKRKIAIIIRRQRMQDLLNQRELDGILTDKQKELLKEWKKKRWGIESDSTTNK
jgi:Spy/CpxP family protein refolding chaperone